MRGSPLDLSDDERESILRYTFAGDDLTRRLRIVSREGKSAVCRFTLAELENWPGT